MAKNIDIVGYSGGAFLNPATTQPPKKFDKNSSVNSHQWYNFNLLHQTNMLV